MASPTIDQSIKLTRDQKSRVRKIVWLCLILFALALVDVFVPDWRTEAQEKGQEYWQQTVTFVKKTTQQATAPLTSRVSARNHAASLK